ncbi:MAG: cyanophycinase [Thermoanaerobaculia bacterium]
MSPARARLAIAALVVLVGCAALPAAALAAGAPPGRGHLLLTGGGGEPDAMWAKFFELAGGKDAPIVVLPTASERPEAGSEYVEELAKKWGATHAQWLELRTRADADRPDFVATLRAARAIFFTGGDQVRITEALLGSPALDAVRSVYARGGVLAGTSAGTACMSAVMITGEGDFTVVRAGAVETKTGLGFVTRAIVDQHFVTRQRSNRLLSVVLEHPELPGLGIDEVTTAWFRPDDTVEILGEGSVLVFDATRAAVAHAAESDKPHLGARGVTLHVLLPGERYDLARRTVLGPRKRVTE